MKAERFLPLLLGILTPTAATAVTDTATGIFAPGFSTLKVQLDGDFLAPPVIRLGDSRMTLYVSFDELGDEHRYMRCSLEHLTPLWQPSGLLPSEYASGFNEAEVADYAYSQNTFRHYVNYRISIPSQELYPLISGNYLLRVWDEEEPDSTLLQARLCVSENVGTITGEASHITDRGSAGEFQQVSFTFSPGNFQLQDVFSDLQAIVVQNSDPSTAVSVKPLRMQGGSIVYEHRPELIFPAGNEFRRFETTRTDYTGMHIARNGVENGAYSSWLNTDEERADRPYEYDRTQYGRFKVDEYNASDPDLGADYVKTYFTLDFPQVMNGDVYVDGEFTHHRLDDSNRMTWDAETHTYTLPILLKQGSYNYRYVLRGHNPADKPDPAPVEGNHYETRNEYTIYIYYTPPGARYSRLLNVAVIRP